MSQIWVLTGGRRDEGVRPERTWERNMVDVIQDPLPSVAQLDNQIMMLSHSFDIPKFVASEDRVISFSRSELAATKNHGSQPIIITICPGNSMVQRVMVDSGASRNVLYYDAFKRMNYTNANLVPYKGFLEGITNHSVKVKGQLCWR